MILSRTFLALALAALGCGPLSAADHSQTGRNLAATCTSCHGSNGHSAGGIASLAGRSADELFASLQAFRNDEREATIMGQISKGYSPAQLEQISRWFATQPARSH